MKQRQLVPAEDEDIARIFQEKLEEDGVEVHISSSLERVDQTAKTAIWKSGQREFKTKADYILVAIGRKPRLDGLQLEQAGVDFLNRHSGEWAHADERASYLRVRRCNGGIQLAHAAFHEGIIAASHASGRDVKINEKHVPRCIYTSPEIACIGMTERQARSVYGDVKIGEFPFSANGKALIKQQAEGKVKIIAEPEFGEIVGVSMIGPDVTELIGQGSSDHEW